MIEVRREERETERIETGPAASYALELADFEAAVRGECEPRFGRDDAVAQARVIAALYAAAESGEPQRVG